jgi:hypothetical protein
MIKRNFRNKNFKFLCVHYIAQWMQLALGSPVLSSPVFSDRCAEPWEKESMHSFQQQAPLNHRIPCMASATGESEFSDKP